MGKLFFNDWELWQKMTFVLGVCIFTVFCIAWGKLVWMNRLVRKQEVIDEEKRTRIQELRQSGQIIETPKTHDIPFGVRAIQSGVQVDGIWISNTSTPALSELNFGCLGGSFSVATAGMESTNGAKLAVKGESPTSPKSVRTPSRQRRSSFRSSESGSSFVEHVDGIYKVDPASNRKSYQPRQSSHLRYDSHGAYDEETLGHLEGNAPPRKKIQAHRLRGSQQIHSKAESSAADNEQNYGTSSDSDATFSEAKVLAGLSSVRSIPMLLSFKADHFNVPTESPAHEMSDPFASSMEPSLSPRFPSAQAIRVSSWFDDSSDNSAQPRSHSPFVPGELHMNKSIRKVNSGFEVLPAGTFGQPVDCKGKGIGHGEGAGDEGGDKRRSNRLQKKGRNSSVVDRLPGTTEQT